MESSINIALEAAGIVYRQAAGAGASWELERFTNEHDAQIAAFVLQLEDLGLAEFQPDGAVVVRWPSVYETLHSDDIHPTSDQLPVPRLDESLVPALASRGTLDEHRFDIYVDGWQRRAHGSVEVSDLTGPTARVGERRERVLLSAGVFFLLEALQEFRARPDANRERTAHQAAWGSIRPLATAAGASLDGFLRSTVVERPQRLTLGLERTTTADGMGVTIDPSFEGAPDRWLETLDRRSRRGVRSSYTVDDGEVQTQVVIDPQVAAVLTEIHALPGRTATGARARRILENPLASLGTNAGQVLDADAVEAELAAVREGTWQFQPRVQLDPQRKVQSAGLELTETSQSSDARTELRLFASPGQLQQFLEEASPAIASDQAFVRWLGRELELDDSSQGDLALLSEVLGSWERALAVRTTAEAPSDGSSAPDGIAAPLLIDASVVLDLDRYHDRVEAIGLETAYGIITVPLNSRGAWLPEDQELVLSLAGPEGTPPTEVPMTLQDVGEFIENVAHAVEHSEAEVTLPPGGTMPTPHAREIVAALPRGLREAATGVDTPAHTDSEDPAGPAERVGLLTKSNIDSQDYIALRASLLAPAAEAPKLPNSLRPEIKLKEHQLEGVRWLQHLYAQAPEHCRGALLADDMGLGKTLQSLVLIAQAREEDPDVGPALVVAPVSLLENWQQEIDRFFEPGALKSIRLQGEGLKEHRVSKASIDPALRAQGLERFLLPGWHDGIDVVLTTYETLRDYEFSFGDVGWSIVICDEAQKIKNPNTLVSRAAKKLKAKFCVAATGTPVENNLTDLWSLFDFIQPGLLPALNQFNKLYRRPIEAQTEAQVERLEELRATIKPQILRRLKSDIAQDLPEKRFDEPCRELPMSAHQRGLYDAALEALRLADQAAGGTAMLNALAHMRRICSDPRSQEQLGGGFPPLTEYRFQSPKLGWLLDTLKRIESQGEKAIVFLERKDTQLLVQHYIRQTFGLAPAIINGDTSTSGGGRQKRIDHFQSRPGFGVLILSPLAAGVGLNIQGANHVIHFMRHWNPAREDQATDRAFRIGQERDVTVYTPIVTGDGWTSFDQRLDELLLKKRRIADDMLNGADDISAEEMAGALLHETEAEPTRDLSAAAAASTPPTSPATAVVELSPSPPPAPAAPAAPAWFGGLLASTVFEQQRSLAGSSSLDNNRLGELLGALVSGGGSLTHDALHAQTGWSTQRLPNILAAAERLLNVEGSPVLVRDRAAQLVRFDVATLRRQFRLTESA